jgi:hypothetical protein
MNDDVNVLVNVMKLYMCSANEQTGGRWGTPNMYSSTVQYRRKSKYTA